MKPVIKIVKHDKGYTAVYLKKVFFVNTWKPLTHYMGLPGNPFYYKSYESAFDGALLALKAIMYHNQDRV